VFRGPVSSARAAPAGQFLTSGKENVDAFFSSIPGAIDFPQEIVNAPLLACGLAWQIDSGKKA
jgi:hypothetical protein